MQDQKEKKFLAAPTGRLNADDVDAALLVNEWCNAENVRTGTTDAGVTDVVESIGSTIQLDTPQPSVNYLQIGIAIDEQNDRFLYFMLNTTGKQDKIMCYDITAQTIYTVLLASQVIGGLNFNQNYPIHSARVVNGLLYYTDGQKPSGINDLAPMTATLQLGGTLGFSNYSFLVTAFNSAGVEIEYSTPSNVLSPTLTDKVISLTNIPISNNPDVVGRYLYASIGTGYFRVQTLDNISTSFVYGTDLDFGSPMSCSYFAYDIKRIDIDAGIKLNQPNYVTSAVPYVAPLNQSVITLIRRPPGTAPTATKTFSGGGIPNLLPTFAGQFAFQYTYWTGETSVFSPPSNYINYNFPTENYDYVQVFFTRGNLPQQEIIDQDVQIVSLAVRYDNTGTYFIIKQWDKLVAADAATIANFNNNTGNLFYDFYNNVLGQPVDQATSIKAADSIPVECKTLETGKDVLILGNYLKAYNTPGITSLAVTQTITTGSTANYVTFKSASTYRVGIRFRDNYKRQCNVITNNTLDITIAARDFNFNTYTTALHWALSNANAINEIPDWAVYYDILVTKNQETRSFVDSLSYNTQYVIRNPANTPTPYTYTYVYTAQSFALALDTVELTQSGLGYVFAQGDRAKVYIKGGATYDVAVLGQDGYFVYVDKINLGLLTLTSGNISFEIYTPYQSSLTESFFTTGLSFNIIAPGTYNREYSQLSGDITGDTARIYRTLTFTTFSVSFFCEVMSPNDTLWQNYFGIYGETNIQSILGQVDKKLFISWSNTYIPATQSNGLSTFDPLDEISLPLEMGAIQKLQLTSKSLQEKGSVLLAIGTNETVSIYLGETQTYGSANAATLTVSTQTIGTQNILKGSYGTVNPESVTEWRGNVYWYDANNGKYIQYADNGMFPISNYKTTRFWKLFSILYLSMTKAEIENLGSRPFVFSTVDFHNRELLISIPKLSNTPPMGYLPDYPEMIYPFDIWDAQGKTIVYKLEEREGNPHWQGAYSFNPEGFVSLQDKVYSFYQGHLYQHNSTTSFNNFYGIQYKSRIMVIFNQVPNRPKVYNNISIEANDGQLLPSLVYFLSQVPYQQSSDLADFQWTNLEGFLYSVIYRNKLVPTAIGFNTNGLLTAEKMRTYALRVLLEFSVTDEPLQLRIIELGYDISRGHTT